MGARASGLAGVTAMMVSAGFASAALAQGQMIAVSATAVQQGQPVQVSVPPCAAGQQTVLINRKLFPFKPVEGGLELPTASLPLGAHLVTTTCGDVPSDPVEFTIVPPRQAQAPTVTCARNVSPRDGFAEAVTTGAREAESVRVKTRGEAEGQGYPTPAELGFLIARCDQEWAWTFRLEDTLSLNVSGFSEWRALPDNARTPLHLFVDGIELTNLSLKRISQDPATKVDRVDAILAFETEATAPEDRQASRNAWAQLLRTARSKGWKYGVHDLVVSMGPAGGPHWPTTAKLRINPYPTGLTIFGAIGALALLALLGVLAIRTPLLRDTGGTNAPFSLAKVQMAIWFVVIFGSSLFLIVTTGQEAALSSTALILVGISGATGLVALAIDNRKDEVQADEQRTLDAERTSLETERDSLTSELDAIDGLRAKRKAAAAGSAEAAELDTAIQAKAERFDAVTKRLREIPKSTPAVSKGWLTDILSDEHGISFHRLQMAAWTFALVGVFVVAVWRTFAMAEFDAMTLGLLGISSGTYLGFKFPERR